MENQPKHKCFNCGNFNPFYTRKDTCFKREKTGYCWKHSQIKDHNEICDNWRSKPACRYSIKWNTTRVLRELLFQLSALRQILEEEKDAESK